MSWESIPGWFGFRNTYDRMVDLSRDGDTIVEIGVAFGRSLAYLARKVIDSGKRITIVGVDPWIDDMWEMPAAYGHDSPRPSWGGEYAQWARDVGGPYNAFVESMRRTCRAELERCTILRTTSALASRIVGPCSGVLIDGNHSYESVTQDIGIWRPHIRPGGMLAGDDYSKVDFPGVVRACNDAFGDAYIVDGTTWEVRL